MAARTNAARRVATYLVLMTRQWANQYAKLGHATDTQHVIDSLTRKHGKYAHSKSHLVCRRC